MILLNFTKKGRGYPYTIFLKTAPTYKKIERLWQKNDSDPANILLGVV